MEQHEYFNLFHNISTADYRLLTSKFRRKIFKKGEHNTVPGQVQKALYFVKSGVQMSYFDANEKKYTSLHLLIRSMCVPYPNLFSSRNGQNIILHALQKVSWTTSFLMNYRSCLISRNSWSAFSGR